MTDRMTPPQGTATTCFAVQRKRAPTCGRASLTTNANNRRRLVNPVAGGVEVAIRRDGRLVVGWTMASRGSDSDA